ncbi:hypothetical protein C9374_003850 [Naegleria lovaniensis]|uniref:RGS domain-containing protein n=1 Tax=Naegleria lovaniensis TaxID=51637 RepID=A0AA88KSE7_NAELO|nr:uncharacterized protein C9374_003850 [Naegleria lovaniensis]KAG2394086.1 hypothetical protein C9374_003850 [Naegleria lovaniensis]
MLPTRADSNSTSSSPQDAAAHALSHLKVYNWDAFVQQMILSVESLSTQQQQPLTSNTTDSTKHPTTTIIEMITPDLATLSMHFTLLIQIRRYTRHGGCGFCTRRNVQVAEGYKSLLQLGILPIIVHAESEEEANQFFAQFTTNPLLVNMLRVSDSEYQWVEQLVSHSSEICRPLRLEALEDMGTWAKLQMISPYMKATQEGYQFNRDTEGKEYAKNSNLLVPKFLLVKNKQVVYEWDQALGDEAPEIFKDVLFHPHTTVWIHMNLLEECNETTFPYDQMKSVPRYRKVPKTLDFELVTKEQQEKEFLEIPNVKKDPQLIREKLDALLKDDTDRIHLKIFACQEFTLEYLLLWENIQEYKSLVSTMKDENRTITLTKVALHIYKKFIGTDNNLYNVTPLYPELKKKAEMIPNVVSHPQYFMSDECVNLFLEIEQYLLDSVLSAMYVRFLNSSRNKSTSCNLQ